MADISNKTLGTIVGIAIFISVMGLFVSNGGLTGFAVGTTGQGQARINITRYIALNMTHNLIDFGNGTLAIGFQNCTLASNKVGDPLSCFRNLSGSDGPQSGGFALENVGNTRINVTVKATKNGTPAQINSASFWNSTTNARYMYKCRGNGTSLITAYTAVQNKTIYCMKNVPANVSKRFVLDVNITIPPYKFGVKNDTLTFTASYTP